MSSNQIIELESEIEKEQQIHDDLTLQINRLGSNYNNLDQYDNNIDKSGNQSNLIDIDGEGKAYE